MKTLITLSITFFLTTIIQAQTWTNIGPNFGGYLRDFAFHPTNSNKIFVGGDDSAGIWVSEDGGQTWRLVTEELPNMSGWHIEFDKTDTNLLYACDLYNRYGVAKSIDGGETWTTSSNGLNTIGARTVSKIAILNQDTLFISTGLEHDGRTGDGIYKSTDGGLNWNPSGEQGLTCPAIVITQTERLLAATQGQGLHFSDDFGSTWQNHPDISTIDTISQIEIKDSFIVVSTNPSGLYVSSDNGLTFNNIGGAAFDIAIGNTQPNLMIYSSLLLRYEYDYTTNVLVSTNSINNIILTQDTVLYMGIGAKGDTVMLGQLGNSSLSISTDAGNSWINPPTSPAANNINDIAIDPTNPNHIFASLVASNSLGIDKECLIETTNGGNTWVRKGPKESGLKVKFHPVSSDTLLCGTFTGGLYKSVDGGNTWNNLIDSTRIVEIGYNPVYPNEVLVSEINEIASPNYQRLLKSIDGGNTFFQVAPVAVSQIAYIPNSDSIVASVNTAASFNGLFLSTDRGDNWASWTLSGDTIKTVRYHNGSIYAGTESGQLYKVNSSGTQNITGGWNQLTEI
ncbi:MAG: hypothetical protein KDD24_09775, partial [Flavobacteriales bacterium]|nr:hypothetical protein [Flavobacteriales bacterium]